MVVGLAGVSGRLAAQAPSTPIRVTAENVRLNNYLHDLAGPGALIGVLGGGVLEELWRKPGVHDGEQDFGHRIAARAGQAAVQVSVRHGLAALMHHSTRYEPCGCSGFGPKVEHALLETFTDRRADGSRALAVPDLAGAYAGSFARLAWDQDRSVGQVALGTTLSFGFTALFNIARELTGVGR